MHNKIEPLLQYLNSLDKRADLSVLQKIVSESGLLASDVSEHCIFNENHYARNKVSSSPWYDLFIMCWKPGQCSAIHDHTDSSCSFRILKGTATEVVYALTDPEKKRAISTDKRTYQLGQVCSAQDQEIHKISNESSSDELITMHIYSPPLKMSVYDEDTAPPMHARTSTAPLRAC